MKIRVIADSNEVADRAISKHYVGRTTRRIQDSEENMSLQITSVTVRCIQGELGYWVHCPSEFNHDWVAAPACYKIEVLT